MIKKNSIRMICFVIVLMVSLLRTAPVFADGIGSRIGVSDLTPDVGQTVTVTVGISVKLNLTNYDVLVVFDPEYLTYIDGKHESLVVIDGQFGADYDDATSSVLVSAICSEPINDVSNLFTLQFKTKTAGKTKISLPSGSTVNAEALVSSSSDEIVISEPVPKSNVNTLKSLEISPGTLSPAFTPERTNYSVSVEGGISKITVSAVPTDSKVKSVNVNGSKSLEVGTNYISVVVTAENGDVKTYTLTVTVAAATPGPTATPEPTPTPEATPTPSPTPSPTPEPTPPVQVNLPAGSFEVLTAPPDVPIPTGFYASQTTINGQTVTVYHSIKDDLVLYYLSNQTAADGFYYYNVSTGEYTPYSILAVLARSFTVLTPDQETEVPTGWTGKTVVLDNQQISGWTQNDGSDDLIMLYLMNSSGQKAFYLYDQGEGLIFPFQLISVVNPTGETTSPTTTETSTETTETSETSETSLTTQEPEDEGGSLLSEPWKLISAVLGVVCLILAGLLIWQGIRALRQRGDDEDELPPPPPIHRV